MNKFECFKVNKLLQCYCNNKKIIELLNSLTEKVDDNTNYKDFLDNVLLLINNMYTSNDIDDKKYQELLILMDSFYKEEKYSFNRIKWLLELKRNCPNELMSEHHLNLLSYFDLVNCMLNKENIDYFHSSGFMGYILLDKPLERYHHDIDLFINIKDINKVRDIFSLYDFEFEYTYEKTKDGNYRHGCKINNNIINIPIWLSFYCRNKDGSIYVEEYYETGDKKGYTKRNYNSPDCSFLSLTDSIHNGILYHSISLEALYVSKETERPKDIFDRMIMKDSIDLDKVKRIDDELSMEWEVIEGIPNDIRRISEVYMENKNGIMFTKK